MDNYIYRKYVRMYKAKNRTHQDMADDLGISKVWLQKLMYTDRQPSKELKRNIRGLK